MSGLRERKKSEIRTKILEISKKAFLDNGYDKTSTKVIAKNAGIGAGTLFNYFPTKADILLEILFSELDDTGIHNELVIDSNSTATDIIHDYLISTVKPVLSMPSALLREFGIAFLTLTKKRNLIQKAIETDMATILILENLIEKSKKANLIQPKKDTKRLARLIYSELFFDMMLFIFENDFSSESLSDNLKESICFLIE